MMNRFLSCLVVIVLFIVSCSPTKRFNRLVEKHPYLLTQDTVIQIDTVTIKVPITKVDSVMQLDSFLIELHDTIRIEKERLKIEIFRVHDSIIIDGKCDTIFIDKIIEREVPVKYYEKISKWSFKQYALLGLALIFLLLILIVIVKLIQVLK